MDAGPLVVVALACGLIGAVIAGAKRMGPGGGFFLGLLLGPIGILLVLFSAGRPEPTTLQRIQARPAQAGWEPDPLGRFDGRYFDGTEWTQHVGRVDGDGTRRTLEDPI